MPRAPVITIPPPPPPRPRRPSPRPSAGDDDALARAALWSASFHRFFGGQYGREQLPNDVRPLSCGEASLALSKIVKNRRHTVRGCLARMLASGYIPDPHNAERFRRLALRAEHPDDVGSPEDAIASLREMGMQESAASSGTLEVPRDAPRVPITGPTVVTFRDNAFTVEKVVNLPHPYERVRPLVRPKGWKRLGPFWRKIEEHWEAWAAGIREGTIFEHFVIDWNNVAMQEFEVVLKATQRSKAGFIRTDYSLVYEKDGKLLVDEGFGQAEAIAGSPGWTRYTGRKTLKFASSALNALSPGIMAMFLETQATGLNEALNPRKRRRR